MFLVSWQTAAKVGENLVDPEYSRAQAKLQPDGSVFLKPDFILDGEFTTRMMGRGSLLQTASS